MAWQQASAMIQVGGRGLASMVEVEENKIGLSEFALCFVMPRTDDTPQPGIPHWHDGDCSGSGPPLPLLTTKPSSTWQTERYLRYLPLHPPSHLTPLKSTVRGMWLLICSRPRSQPPSFALWRVLEVVVIQSIHPAQSSLSNPNPPGQVRLGLH